MFYDDDMDYRLAWFMLKSVLYQKYEDGCFDEHGYEVVYEFMDALEDFSFNEDEMGGEYRVWFDDEEYRLSDIKAYIKEYLINTGRDVDYE